MGARSTVIERPEAGLHAFFHQSPIGVRWLRMAVFDRCCRV